MQKKKDLKRQTEIYLCSIGLKYIKRQTTLHWLSKTICMCSVRMKNIKRQTTIHWLLKTLSIFF
ncbi:hypothetical protein HanIR_Chr14g0703311 [Helianthus annuus]|nr:hypothetical protein HanIR_Chr14g0703311 [Helianthus annuus]